VATVLCLPEAASTRPKRLQGQPLCRLKEHTSIMSRPQLAEARHLDDVEELATEFRALLRADRHARKRGT